MKKVAHYEYKNREGFLVGVSELPPKKAIRADVICFSVAKRNRRGKLIVTSQWFTPDEAMAVGLSLIRAVDAVMSKHYPEFRNKMERK